MIPDNNDDNDYVFFGDWPESGPNEGLFSHKADIAVLIMSRNKTATTNLDSGHVDMVEVEATFEEEALARLCTRV